MSFKLAQTFYLDKTAVRNSEDATISSIDVYFKSKPKATSNRSGITKPGVTMYLMQVTSNGIPDDSKIIETGYSRLDYDSIIATADASIPSSFVFRKPVILDTDASYAFGIMCDGDEEYEIWSCKEGELILGTNTPSSGSTAKNVGGYYQYASDNKTWTALKNIDAKFSVKVGAYSSNTSSTTMNTTYILPSDPAEYIIYDRYNYQTINRNNLEIGELVFQETPVIYGTIKVNSSNLSIVAVGNVNFTTLLTPSATEGPGSVGDSPTIDQKCYIVIRNGSDNNADVNVREVISIDSNTQITIDRLPTFTNNSATFSVTPAGKVVSHNEHWYTGRWWNGSSMDSFIGQKVDIIKLTDTSSNSDVRFVNNMVTQITINSGGLGYSNGEIVTVYPVTNTSTSSSSSINYIQSYSNATAKIVTNGSGTITGLAVTNAGYGLIANTVLSISTANGTSANLNAQIGSKLRSETSNATFGNTIVTDISVHRSYPHCVILSNQHHTYKLYQHYPFYVMPGKEHILNMASPALVHQVDTFNSLDMLDIESNDGRVYVLASRSNEVKFSGNVSLKTSNGAVVNTAFKASSVLEVAITSNNIYSLPMVNTDDVYNYYNIINNTYDGETKGSGTALARHISTKVTFADNRTAEDLVVYINAYRPIGTDIKLYAKMYNSTDPDSFDDKDWTLLSLKSNNATSYSSLTNDQDIIQYTFGLSEAQSVNTISGDVTTTLNSSNLVGLGTTFNSDLEVDDVIKIYSSLFPQKYMVSVVTSVANGTQITIADPISNNSYVGSGFKIDLIGRPSDGINDEIGSPFQTFINPENDNVCRYYNDSMTQFDGYNTFQVKIVLTSNSTVVVPKIDNISAVGVSA